MSEQDRDAKPPPERDGADRLSPLFVTQDAVPLRLKRLAYLLEEALAQARRAN
ncbi:hypothetical protein [Paracoccus jeotgali]|uniref:hypothetical protein n=1 Tax=Paracoccus jeotgali TaxID=2065379 RepID=UPI0013153047|nr:hypothetical protein [Paracoccus jeotgali]